MGNSHCIFQTKSNQINRAQGKMTQALGRSIFQIFWFIIWPSMLLLARLELDFQPTILHAITPKIDHF